MSVLYKVMATSAESLTNVFKPRGASFRKAVDQLKTYELGPCVLQDYVPGPRLSHQAISLLLTLRNPSAVSSGDAKASKGAGASSDIPNEVLTIIERLIASRQSDPSYEKDEAFYATKNGKHGLNRVLDFVRYYAYTEASGLLQDPCPEGLTIEHHKGRVKPNDGVKLSPKLGVFPTINESANGLDVNGKSNEDAISEFSDWFDQLKKQWPNLANKVVHIESPIIENAAICLVDNSLEKLQFLQFLNNKFSKKYLSGQEGAKPVFSSPGGKCKPHELSSDAAVRETTEEIGEIDGLNELVVSENYTSLSDTVSYRQAMFQGQLAIVIKCDVSDSNHRKFSVQYAEKGGFAKIVQSSRDDVFTTHTYFVVAKNMIDAVKRRDLSKANGVVSSPKAKKARH